MKKIFFLLLLVPAVIYAQDKGIHFEHGLSWAAVQAKAKAEKKFIFMDCFTTWCGPCKYMSKTIFPMDEVGTFFNQKYISVKVQLDTTATDNADVKSWYTSGHDIAKQYQVRAYPTYLFFDPNGNVVHRAVGSSDATTFLTKAHDALNPETQYYTLLKKYEQGKKDPEFLRKMAKTALDAYDLTNAHKIGDEYLATQTDLYTKENLDLLKEFTQTSKDKGFQMMLQNPARVDSILGKGTSSRLVQNIILGEEVYPVIFAKRVKSQAELEEPDWAKLEAGLKEKYPAQTPEVMEAMAYSKVLFYRTKNDWPHFATSVVDYMKAYSDKTSPEQLNDYAWTVFQNCADMTCVAEALDWSKRSFADNQNPAFIDTYANILYKMGKKDEALEWEQKAVSLVSEAEKKTYEETLEKMKKGEKTWN